MAPKETPQPPAEASEAPKHSEGVHVSRPQAAPQVERQPQAVIATEALTTTGLQLPLSIVSRSDVSRCIREIDRLNDYFHQAGIRGGKDQPLPSISRVLEGVVQANGLNLLNADHRDQLKSFLAKIKASGPIIHMSFPSEASNQFIGKIIAWFRAEAHPHAMLHIGLQPELAAGCLVRTTNKVFDFSFRKRFEQSKRKLLSSLEELDKEPDHQPVAAATDTVVAEAQL